MLSLRLTHLIETHWEEIASRLIAAIRYHPDMPNLAARTDAEIREWCQGIVKNLGYLLSAKKDEEIRRRFQILGRMRFEENIPLHEAVLRLQILKDKITGFVHEQGFPMTVLQLYSEEELELRMGASLTHRYITLSVGTRAPCGLRNGWRRRPERLPLQCSDACRIPTNRVANHRGPRRGRFRYPDPGDHGLRRPAGAGTGAHCRQPWVRISAHPGVAGVPRTD